MFSVEYRFGKSTDTCSSDQNCRQTYPFDQTTEEGPSDFDVRHSFKLFGTWDLPIFRDRRDLVGILLGGWQLSGIVTASSGFPWTPVFGGGLCQAAVAGGGVCPLRPIDYTGGALDDTSNDVFMQQWGQFPGGPLAVLHAAAAPDRSPRCRGPASAATASAVRTTSRWTPRS